MPVTTPPQRQRSGRPRTAASRYHGPYLVSNGTSWTDCPRHPWAAPSVIRTPGGTAVCVEGGHLVEEESRRVTR